MSVPEDDRALSELVQRAKAQDPDAETELHDRYRPFVRRRLEETRKRRNWFWIVDPSSVVQEVFASFYKALRGGKFTFEGKRRLEGFLIRTTWFVAMNLKDKAREERAVSLFDAEEGGLRFDVASFAEAAYDQIDRQACLRLLAAAIEGLNPSRRDMVERTLLGQKVRDICAETGRTAGSVSGLKFNAFVDLRKRLSAGGFVERCGKLFQLEETE